MKLYLQRSMHGLFYWVVCKHGDGFLEVLTLVESAEIKALGLELLQ